MKDDLIIAHVESIFQDWKGGDKEPGHFLEDLRSALAEALPSGMALSMDKAPSGAEHVRLRVNEALENAALACHRIQKEPSSLWEEAGCWAHSASNCADAVRALKDRPSSMNNSLPKEG